eukprot:CAMPEP_0176446560 /NCGR_PEP_ID=MMETSP0127-20121128/24404_1 /TAXON_ID=938130 /ORGANISM="Platyophrya macrostoma, Strain WH" /LENGTH=284 /DNA_ID=CAMNT_0017832629 /DNA_START=71 /DNA_END=925 /DNA_ORIENTATION=+
MRRLSLLVASPGVLLSSMPLLRGQLRRQSTTTAETTAAQSAASSTSSSTSAPSDHASRISAAELADRCAAARQAIHDLWMKSAAKTSEDGDARSTQILALLQTFNISPSTPREEDIVRGLGEAFDRLLLLSVPFSSKGDTVVLETLLACAGRQGREISVKTLQHLFARSGSYAEAIAIFHTMRKCNVAMNMEAYHAMIYSLQRLEEESWALKFADELEDKKSVSEQAMDFVLNGCDNQLIPESKPWLGRVMYKDDPNAPVKAFAGKEEFDALNAQWVNRYKTSV